MAQSTTTVNPGTRKATSVFKFLSRLFPKSFTDLAVRRIKEFFGTALILVGFTLVISILSYNPSDPSLNSSTSDPVKNMLGLTGSYLADFLLQIFGIVALLPSLIFSAWGWRFLNKKVIRFIWLRILALITGLLLASIAFSVVTPPEAWPLRSGIGGVAGQTLFLQIVTAMTDLDFLYSTIFIVILSSLSSIAILIYAGGLDRSEWAALGRGIQSSALIWNHIISLTRQTKALKKREEPTFGANKQENENDVKISSTAIPNSPPSSTATKPNELIITEKTKKVPAGARSKDAGQGTFNLPPSNIFQLPPLDILEAPPVTTKIDGADKSALAQNAEFLEGVLQDFGIKGTIVNVRPGPVVTLYELEPAPGTKTSRVVGLSDDIARSMSALSVRIAVVPGHSVIGIELPNAKRDTVFFRELLASAAYEKTSLELPLVLGKDIGGSPCVVDLARMPHLLIAGTTGSGKSVAINTMICSLLFRLNPDECKFIMVDPKMLELSVYDGIPHLLTPVVTEPSKAVTALKWAVREMEDRYRLMSQMGVRNILGYNARLSEAMKKGESLVRRVQTGFDEAGMPVYEDQPLGTDPLPLIVIVVDEMADLMMVAGKDIEALIQRLAQMARAAGIHLIMATQRPSVDVITGTIKANFPTRISFQVTSKIDSRTILGEQGAEQLLGQGDMLYMAGGGQITRVHGPFVSDSEVEQIVNSLKAQGDPKYIEAVTKDIEDSLSLSGASTAENGDKLYDEAVAIVAQEGKASTSLIQRRLQIGYNRAARIIEQMEAQEIIGKADRVGRREVLVGAH
jgi:S-DNA-T family DNA segregation ATPase FtsK/SpoIIIE